MKWLVKIADWLLRETWWRRYYKRITLDEKTTWSGRCLFCDAGNSSNKNIRCDIIHNRDCPCKYNQCLKYKIIMKELTIEEKAQAYDKALEMAKDAQIHLSPTEEPEQEPSVWSPHSYEITGTMTIDQKDAKRLLNMFLFSRKERRKMFHAVTHGQAIVFVGHFNTEGNEPFEAPVCIDRPSVLRKALAIAHNTRFQYAIVPADCCTLYVHLHL